MLSTLPLHGSSIAPTNPSAQETNLMFEFPKLTGLYAVSTSSRHVIDQKRIEPCNPSAKREIMIDLWFPTSGTPNETLTAYCPTKIPLAKKNLLNAGYPEADLAQLDSIFTYVAPNKLPRPTTTPYPVILFSHGYLGATPSAYSVFLAELASHGYIVAAIAHPYFAEIVLFPDGRTITMDMEKTKNWSFERMCSDQEIWVKDAQCALAALEKMNLDPQDALCGLLDLNNVGMLGHSFGGSTAFLMCLKDARVKAGINLDGSLQCNESPKDLHKPFMFMWADSSVNQWNMTNQELTQATGSTEESIQKYRTAFENSHNTATSPNISKKIIANFGHSGFSNLLILKEMPCYKNNKHIVNQDESVGTADGFEAAAQINSCVVNFFGKHLARMG